MEWKQRTNMQFHKIVDYNAFPAKVNERYKERNIEFQSQIISRAEPVLVK